MIDDYEERREKRRQEEREYQADVAHEVWHNNGNPDAVDRDRVQDDFYRGMDFIQAASDEMRHQRPKHREPGPEEEFAPDNEP